MPVLSELYIPERVMNSTDPAELSARRLFEQKTAEALELNSIVRDEKNNEIRDLEQGIKDGINKILGNQDGEKKITLDVKQAQELFDYALGTNAQELSDGVAIFVSRESPESRIVIIPNKEEESGYMHSLRVNGPLTATDLTLLAREKIRAERSGSPIDPLGEKLRILKGWDRIVSHLVEPHSLPPAQTVPASTQPAIREPTLAA